MAASRNQHVLRNLSSRLYLPRVVTYAVVCLIALPAAVVLFSGDLNSFVLAWYVFAIIAFAPLFLCTDLLHPLILFLPWQFLLLVDFANKYLFEHSLRFAPGLQPYDVYGWMTMALYVCIVWYLGLFLGFWYGSRLRIARKSFALLRASLRAPKVAATILAALALAAFLFALSLTGGLAGMMDVMNKRADVYSGYNHIRLIVLLGAVAAVLLVFSGRLTASTFLLFPTLIATALFGTRTPVVFGILVPYVIAYHYRVKRIPLFAAAALGAGALLFVIAWGDFRAAPHRARNVETTEVIGDAARDTGLADTIPSLLWGLESGKLDYQYGRTILNAAFGFVPRTLWSEKPPSNVGHLIGPGLMGKDFKSGLPPGPYGIAYFNFAWAGLIPMGFITGLLSALLYHWFLTRVAARKWQRVGVILYPFLIVNVYDIFNGGKLVSVGFFVVAVFLAKFLADLYAWLQSSGEEVTEAHQHHRGTSAMGSRRRSRRSRRSSNGTDSPRRHRRGLWLKPNSR